MLKAAVSEVVSVAPELEIASSSIIAYISCLTIIISNAQSVDENADDVSLAPHVHFRWL